MKNCPVTSMGSSILSHWNDITTLERVKMVLRFPDHFLSLGLVTQEELDGVSSTSETEWEYIIQREEQPLFQNINVKYTYSMQKFRDQLKAALKAVFC